MIRDRTITELEYLSEKEEAQQGLLLNAPGNCAMYSWQAKHPGSCPMCGLALFVHEELGSCPYYDPELLD